MTNRRVRALALVPLLLAAACASPVVTTELGRIDQRTGYRHVTLEATAPKAIDRTAIAATFSGGGTRAAALADGALRALARTDVSGRDGQPVPLASQIDVISSVSGGSVTAANFALNGVGGMDAFERDFLRHDVMGELIWRTMTNPFRLLYPRIDVLVDYFDDEVFRHKTYRDLAAADGRGAQRRPYVVLNAADMVNGGVFSFTQDQFDLMCADLGPLKLAQGVAASAAFPVALSPLTVENRAPCPAQREAAARTSPPSGWRADGDGPVPLRVLNDRAVESGNGLRFPDAGRLDRYRRGTLALDYLNRTGAKPYIHLLDGGIADNVALTLPLTLLTSSDQAPSFLNWLNTGKADKLLLVVVNARNQPPGDTGLDPKPPGMFEALGAAINTAIDGNTFKLIDRLEPTGNGFRPKSVVLVDFDLIDDATCRARFHAMPTTWTLPEADVDDLIAIGEAMVLQSPSYQEFVKALGHAAPTPRRTVAEICAGKR